MESFKFCAPCLLGLEGLAAEELKRLEAREVSAENGRVFFAGDAALLARANLRSRYAERIQVLLGRFRAATFERLFDGVYALPWDEWIGRRDAFPVKGHSVNSKLASVPACQSIIKKAVTKKLASRYHLSWFEETGVKLQIQFLIMKDEVLVTLDTTGAGLHKRGYRRESAEAPIKETLAAAMAWLARAGKLSPIADPFCGSGTILIESALLAKNIAPGLRRKFAAEEWGRIVPETVWRDERQAARADIRTDSDFAAFGFDIDPTAVALTQRNAAFAGVSGCIKAAVRDIADFSPEGGQGVVITNPPYGERLLDVQAARKLYVTMRERFVAGKGWSYNIITPDEDFEQIFGKKADKRRKLYNGMIKCQYYMYFKEAKAP